MSEVISNCHQLVSVTRLFEKCTAKFRAELGCIKDFEHHSTFPVKDQKMLAAREVTSQIDMHKFPLSLPHLSRFVALLLQRLT